MIAVRGRRAGLLALVLLLLTTAPLVGLAVPAAGAALGRVVVLFQPATTAAQRAAVLAGRAAGAQVAVSAVEPRLVQVRVPAGHEHAVAARLRADPAVRAAGVDQPVQAAVLPSDYNATAQPNLAVIGAPAAWTDGLAGGGITVAVVDSGLDTGHPEFSGRIVAPAVFISNFNTACGPTSADVLDNDGHGTHVAGIVAAGANNGGIVGVAPAVAIMPIKVLDACRSGYFSDIVQGIRYAADRGAHVINLSVGGYLSAADPDHAAIIAIVQDVVDYAHARGVVLVGAAGNNALDIDTQPFYPAAARHVLAVAATTTTDSRPLFSNFGTRIDLAAPGADSSQPDNGLYSTLPTYPRNGTGPLNYGYMAGTSMAAPHVAGLAVLLRERDAGLTPDEIRTILQFSAHDLAPAGADPYYGAGRLDVAAALTIQAPPVIRYFAEGYTGTGFDTYLTIQNVNPGPVLARLGFQYSGAASGPAGRYLVLPASSRTTVKVNDIVGPGQPVSITLAAPGAGIYAERPMYFAYNAGVTDGHVSPGAPAPAATWYFAEGYTGPGFDQYLTIQNPNPTAAEVMLTYYLTGGVPPLTKPMTVPANSRSTVFVHEQELGVGRDQAVSAKVESSNGVGIVAERPMYFTYNPAGGGAPITGGSNTVGATAPRTTWYFGEGYTGDGFDEYLTIQNPNDQTGTATITYYLDGAAPVERHVPLPANSRTTVAVHAAYDAATNPGGLGRLSVGHSTRVEASVDVVAERPMYFRYTLDAGAGVITGGHNVMGAPAPAPAWYFPEGYTASGFDEYLTIQNPNPTAAQVMLTYYLADGAAPLTRPIAVPGTSRYTVRVHELAEGVGRNQAVSARVESLTPGVHIIAERPMYFAYPGAIDGGHVGLGLLP